MIDVIETTCELQGFDIVLRQIKLIVENTRKDYQEVVEGLSGDIVTAEVDIIDRVAQIRQCILGALNELLGDFQTNPETGREYCIAPPMPDADSEEFIKEVILESRPRIETLLKRIGAFCDDGDDECPDTERSNINDN